METIQYPLSVVDEFYGDTFHLKSANYSRAIQILLLLHLVLAIELLLNIRHHSTIH